MMKVKIATACSRCGRQEEQEVTLEEAQALQDKTSSTEDFIASLSQFLAEQRENGETNDIPEVVVMLRNADDPSNYQIRALDGLCHRPDAKKMQGCRTRVKNLVSDLFMDQPTNGAEPKQKKKRTKAAEATDAIPAQA